MTTKKAWLVGSVEFSDVREAWDAAKALADSIDNLPVITEVTSHYTPQTLVTKDTVFELGTSRPRVGRTSNINDL